ncbi:hypothetical protein C8R43DRAFT_957946 [Mycena crocata]|nr:hypothetical protein C8R43DRAFT_957946 [Mycena crocata]
MPFSYRLVLLASLFVPAFCDVNKRNSKATTVWVSVPASNVHYTVDIDGEQTIYGEGAAGAMATPNNCTYGWTRRGLATAGSHTLKLTVHGATTGSGQGSQFWALEVENLVIMQPDGNPTQSSGSGRSRPPKLFSSVPLTIIAILILISNDKMKGANLGGSNICLLRKGNIHERLINVTPKIRRFDEQNAQSSPRAQYYVILSTSRNECRFFSDGARNSPFESFAKWLRNHALCDSLRRGFSGATSPS